MSGDRPVTRSQESQRSISDASKLVADSWDLAERSFEGAFGSATGTVGRFQSPKGDRLGIRIKLEDISDRQIKGS